MNLSLKHLSLSLAIILCCSGSLSPLAAAKQPPAAIPPGFKASDLMLQTWDLVEKRISSSAQLQVSGTAGDQFVLLRSPSVLTDFSGPGLRVSQHQLGGNLAYVVSIEDGPASQTEQTYTATFNFQMEVPDPI
ncbi:MAG: hypothetical protein AAGH89_14575, partial [Verrucomicrobiota bacterium]